MQKQNRQNLRRENKHILCHFKRKPRYHENYSRGRPAGRQQHHHGAPERGRRPVSLPCHPSRRICLRPQQRRSPPRIRCLLVIGILGFFCCFSQTEFKWRRAVVVVGGLLPQHGRRLREHRLGLRDRPGAHPPRPVRAHVGGREAGLPKVGAGGHRQRPGPDRCCSYW